MRQLGATRDSRSQTPVSTAPTMRRLPSPREPGCRRRVRSRRSTNREDEPDADRLGRHRQKRGRSPLREHDQAPHGGDHSSPSGRSTDRTRGRRADCAASPTVLRIALSTCSRVELIGRSVGNPQQTRFEGAYTIRRLPEYLQIGAAQPCSRTVPRNRFLARTDRQVGAVIAR